MTWFNAKKYVVWIDADDENGVRPFENILADALDVLAQRGINKK